MSFTDKNIYTAVNTPPPIIPPITFVQSLAYLVPQIPLGNATDGYQFTQTKTALVTSGVFADQVAANAFFASKTKSDLANLTTDEFFSPAFLPGTTTQIASLKDKFVADFKAQLHTEDEGWIPIFAAINEAWVSAGQPIPLDDFIDNIFTAQFGKWFDGFLAGYPDSIVGSTASFLLNASTALSTTATISSDQTLIGGFSGFPSYEEVFKAFNPGASQADINTNVLAFYNHQIQNYGYFVPSQMFAGWVQAVQGGYSGAVAGAPFFGTSLEPANFQKTKILNSIFALIALMIGTMQNVASAQANRLRILTTWQAAYTFSLQQMHTFLVGDNTAPGVGAEDRARINQDINTPNRSLVQTFQSNVSDDAKALQSSINQTSDAVSQQSSIANAIIQELTTLLNAIFR